MERCGFKGRMPKIVACGGRDQAYSKFRIALSGADKDVFLLVDSEDPVRDINKTLGASHASGIIGIDRKRLRIPMFYL